jgi:hypothetical protein
MLRTFCRLREKPQCEMVTKARVDPTAALKMLYYTLIIRYRARTRLRLELPGDSRTLWYAGWFKTT